MFFNHRLGARLLTRMSIFFLKKKNLLNKRDQKDLRRFTLITCITWLKSTSTWKCSRRLLIIATAH